MLIVLVAEGEDQEEQEDGIVKDYQINNQKGAINSI